MNGRSSIINQKKHINIWNFSITDRVKKGGVSLVWFTTWDMIGDYRTKLIQGAMFWNFRDQIMGVIPAADLCPGKVKVE